MDRGGRPRHRPARESCAGKVGKGGGGWARCQAANTVAYSPEALIHRGLHRPRRPCLGSNLTAVGNAVGNASMRQKHPSPEHEQDETMRGPHGGSRQA